jgi:hypothetical protein
MSKTTPNWGAWVTHYDSTGQAATMALTPSPDNTAMSILFDRMVVSLQGNDPSKRAGSAVLAGHFPIQLPDEFRLSGFLLIVRGIVLRSHDASASLALTLGETARAMEWPRRSKVLDSQSGKEIEALREDEILISCFAGQTHLAMGDPPTFPPAPPLTLSLGIHAWRTTAEGSVDIHVDALDITMLRDA